MVLKAIGLLVDEPCRVENVEQGDADEEGLSPKEATKKPCSSYRVTHRYCSSAISVFCTNGLFGGSTGVIYRQFAELLYQPMAYPCWWPNINPAIMCHYVKPDFPAKISQQSVFFLV